ncbi:MAG TPA: glycerate kinase [Aggregatilineaceae bacterium]|nr:glycerate kinase [Aggregatilineaceae bacterium]
MAPSPDLFSNFQRIRTAALQAVDPAGAVRRALRLESDRAILHAGGAAWELSGVDRVAVIAAGKAATAMAGAACDLLGSLRIEGLVVTRHGQAGGMTFPPVVRVFETGHPVPDADGVAAAEAVEQLLMATTDRDRVLVLLSGGASALLPLPVRGISLDDLQQVTSLLLRSGATIHEINTLRKHLERLKGGQMARLAYPGPLSALILSDVVGDPLDVIASGPTVPDPTTFQDCRSIVQKYGLADRLPARVRDYLLAARQDDRRETPKPGDPVFASVANTIVGSNRLAAEAAVAEASRMGYHALLLTTFIEGEAREAGKFAAGLVKGIRFQGTPLAAPACLVWGGETTVTVRGDGKGGRNQELALSAALALDGLDGIGMMALATDGIDGPTDAAGAIITGETAAAAIDRGLDPQAALDRDDSYPLLQAVDALIMTGATGTNVNDLLVILVE